MKRAFSIVLSLAVALAMLVGSTLPALAVAPDTILVTVDNPVGLQDSEYYVRFQNGSTLVGDDGDFIDVTFPLGTTFGNLGAARVYQGATLADVTLPLGVGILVPTGTKLDLIVGQTVRIYLDAGAEIAKYQWVRIEFEDITNPPSCFHHLQVGTRTSSPQSSAEYPIWTAKMELVEGNNLISLPAYPEDTSIEVVLASLFAEAARTAAFTTPFTFSVWHYDSVTKEWLVYASDTSFSSLTTMEAGRAYWIKVNYDFEFFFKGTPYPQSQGPPEIWCYPGGDWAMIGPAIQTATVFASQYLWDTMLPWPNDNTYAVSTITGWNDGVPGVTGFFVDTGWVPGQRDVGAWQGFVPPAQPLPPYQDVNLVQTEGYFMYFVGEACIIPPVGP